jgi:hypothetical protein
MRLPHLDSAGLARAKEWLQIPMAGCRVPAKRQTNGRTADQNCDRGFNERGAEAGATKLEKPKDESDANLIMTTAAIYMALSPI